MKHAVVVDGILASRQQVIDGLAASKCVTAKLEKALVELNTPDPIKCLTRVRCIKDGIPDGVVITGYAQKMYAKGSGFPEGFTVVQPDGVTHTYKTEAALRGIWEVIQ